MPVEKITVWLFSKGITHMFGLNILFLLQRSSCLIEIYFEQPPLFVDVIVVLSAA